MTSISKNRDKELAKIFASISDSNDMHRLMCELMSESEMDDLIKRWVLMEQLMEGKTQRAIAKDLGVSLCKITRGAKVLKHDMSTSRKIIKQRKAG
jgi:TrpR family trp operon transcriptional repressor